MDNQRQLYQHQHIQTDSKGDSKRWIRSAPTSGNLSTLDVAAGSAVAGGQGNLGTGGGGNSVQGLLTFGANTAVTFDRGGVYEFAIQSSGAGAVAGVDYSLLSFDGTFTISADPAHPFTIELISVGPTGPLGQAAISMRSSPTHGPC
jgi:hypothetical protein